MNAAPATLWTDAPDAPADLRRRLEAGLVPGWAGPDLAHLIAHGWVLWERAIEPELIDRFVTDVRGHHRHPGMFVTTDHRSGNAGLKRSGDRPDAFESLFDLYANFTSARDVALHPRIARFLALVFQARPVAFQQLLFQRSNGHPPHQDTAFVAVEEPMLLAATWVALEDVAEGSGELGWYDRSHTLPPTRFADGTRRFGSADNRAAYAAALEAACRERGLPYRTLLAKKGDVFLWTADLVHQSHPRRLPEETSRLSCVTHYCPSTTTPFWFRFHTENRALQPHGIGAIASAYYRLPIDDGMAAPNNGVPQAE